MTTRPVAVFTELRILATIVRESWFIASILLGLLFCSLAYQIPFTTTIHVGGDSASHRRQDDTPYLQGFNGSEPDVRGVDWWTLSPGYGYRWTSTDARVWLPGVGSGRWLLLMTASSGRADGLPTTSEWQLGDQQFTQSISPQPQVYRFVVDANSSGDIDLRFRSPRYQPSVADPRELGFVMSRIALAPATSGVRVPAVGQLGWLALTLALIYTCSRRVGVGARPTAILTLLVGAGLALLLIAQRLVLTIFTPTLVAVLAVCYVLAVVLSALSHPWFVDHPKENIDVLARITSFFWSPVALIVLAFGLRLGGLLHPHTLINDIGLHANNLLELSLGKVFFTEGLPSDAGGGQSPYPPGMYLVLLPLQLLMQTGMSQRILLLNSGVALLDSLIVGLIWLLIRRGGFGYRAAWFGAALYLAPPPLLASFSIGEAANIGGQALAMPAVALLTFLPTLNHSRRDLMFWLLPALTIAFLAHMGVSISLACLLAALWLRVALSSRWRSQLVGLTTVGLLAALIAAAIYYSVPLFTSIFAARVGAGAVAPPSTPPGWLRLFGRAALLFEPGHRITPLLAVGGLAGLVFIGQATKAADLSHVTARWLPFVLCAWWLGMLLSLGLLLIAQQGVREQHFLYPALCLGAGPLFAAWWRRGRAGRVAALVVLLVPIVFGTLFWVEQLIDYLH